MRRKIVISLQVNLQYKKMSLLVQNRKNTDFISSKNTFRCKKDLQKWCWWTKHSLVSALIQFYITRMETWTVPVINLNFLYFCVAAFYCSQTFICTDTHARMLISTILWEWTPCWVCNWNPAVCLQRTHWAGWTGCCRPSWCGCWTASWCRGSSSGCWCTASQWPDRILAPPSCSGGTASRPTWTWLE